MAEAGRLGVTFDGLHKFVEDKERVASDEMKEFEKFSSKEQAQTAAIVSKLNKDRGELEAARSEAVASAAKLEEALARAKHAEQDLSASIRTIKDTEQQLHDLTAPRTCRKCLLPGRLPLFD